MKPVVLIEIDKLNMPEDVTDSLKPFAEVVYQNAPFGEILRETVCMMVGGTRIDSEFLDDAPNLKIVSRFGVGYDVVDVDECTRRRVYVTHTPGVLSEAVADHTWALILGFMRRIPEADHYTRVKWAGREERFPFGWDMNGKVLGLIGLGRIGLEVLKRSQGFGTVNIYYDVVRNEEIEKEYNIQFVEFDKLLRSSDIISVHVPLLPSTKHLLGDREFNLMKPEALVVNTSRGPVIDEEALTRAINEKKIRGAALDVFEEEPTPINNPLLDTDRVVVTPHIASATWETRRMMAETVTENILAYLNGERPPNVVPEQRECVFN